MNRVAKDDGFSCFVVASALSPARLLRGRR
jgi:hypothetical protein